MRRTYGYPDLLKPDGTINLEAVEQMAQRAARRERAELALRGERSQRGVILAEQRHRLLSLAESAEECEAGRREYLASTPREQIARQFELKIAKLAAKCDPLDRPTIQQFQQVVHAHRAPQAEYVQ